MRSGFTVFSANKDVDLALRASPAAADVLMNWRRVVVFMVAITNAGLALQSRRRRPRRPGVNLSHFTSLDSRKKPANFLKKPVASAPILLDMGRFLCEKLVFAPPISP